VNIQLDKAGGLTEALALAAEAKRRGLRIMVGGMISTSLGVGRRCSSHCRQISAISTDNCAWRSIAARGCDMTAA
jgi:L-alanine-DL-glutamate epimerase-like enolase superfamily enzyme